MRDRSIVKGNMPHERLRRVLAQGDLDRGTCAEVMGEIEGMEEMFNAYCDRYVGAMERCVRGRLAVLVPRVDRVVRWHRGIAGRNGGLEHCTLGQAEVLVEEVEGEVEKGVDCWGWDRVVKKLEVCEGIVGVWEGPMGRW